MHNVGVWLVNLLDMCWQVLRTPSGRIVLFEAIWEPFEPLKHAVEVVFGLVLRDGTLDDNIAILDEPVSPVTVGLGGVELRL